MDEKHYELLLTIQKDIEKISNNIVELKDAEEVKLNSIQEAVFKRIQVETGEVADKLKADIGYATKKFNDLDISMFKATCYLDEIGKKILDLEKMLKGE